MSWTDPGLPLWVAILVLLGGLNGLGLLVSVAIERWGLPEGWSIQDVARKPGMLRRHLPLIVGNLTFMLVAAAFSFWQFAHCFVFERPDWGSAALTFGALVLFDDLGFYCVHRALHTNRQWYRRFHKQHHQAFAPVPIEYIHAHPVEWLSGSSFPVLFILAVVGLQGSMNAWVLLAWAAFRTLHELDIHSGTRSVLGRFIPLYGTVRMHDLHHAKPHSGNYASTLTIWDRVFRTQISDSVAARSARS